MARRRGWIRWPVIHNRPVSKALVAPAGAGGQRDANAGVVIPPAWPATAAAGGAGRAAAPPGGREWVAGDGGPPPAEHGSPTAPVAGPTSARWRRLVGASPAVGEESGRGRGGGRRCR